MTDTTRTSERISPRAMTVVWLALVVITVGSWWLAPAHITGTVHENTPITALVLLLAVIKARLIIRYFMEVRTAPRWLRRATDAWLFVLAAAVFTIYLI
jgi:caa(3)-type oxidase subunit IV